MLILLLSGFDQKAFGRLSDEDDKRAKKTKSASCHVGVALKFLFFAAEGGPWKERANLAFALMAGQRIEPAAPAKCGECM